MNIKMHNLLEMLKAKVQMVNGDSSLNGEAGKSTLDDESDDEDKVLKVFKIKTAHTVITEEEVVAYDLESAVEVMGCNISSSEGFVSGSMDVIGHCEGKLEINNLNAIDLKIVTTFTKELNVDIKDAVGLLKDKGNGVFVLETDNLLEDSDDNLDCEFETEVVV